MFCGNCGNKIDDKGIYCEFCGEKVQVKQKDTNIMAIIGLILALISLFLNFWGMVGIAATIISIIGLVKSSENNGNGKSISIIGISIGIISVLYAFVIILLSF